MSSFMRRVIDAVWPSGSAWVPKVGEGMDQLMDGVSDGLQEARDTVSVLNRIRSPAETILLSELELEYGIVPDPSKTDASRRALLAAKRSNPSGVGSAEDLEAVLQAAGFDVFVYSNDPAVNPVPFIRSFLMVAGADNAHAGEPNAVAEITQTRLLVNGDIIISAPEFLMHAGEPEAVAGEPGAVAEITGVIDQLFIYPLPVDPNDWPYVFFVGGVATFAPDGSITDISAATIPADRVVEFERIILQIKPVTTWAVLIIKEI